MDTQNPSLSSSPVPTHRRLEKTMLLPPIQTPGHFFEESLTEADLNNILPKDPLDIHPISKVKFRPKPKVSPKKKKPQITKCVPFSLEKKRSGKDFLENNSYRNQSTMAETEEKLHFTVKLKTQPNIGNGAAINKNRSLDMLSPDAKVLEKVQIERKKPIEFVRRVTPMRVRRDIEKTFDYRVSPETTHYVTDNPNRSCDNPLYTPAVIPVEMYNILKDVNGVEFKYSKEKEGVPYMFMQEEKLKEQKRRRQKSETQCWQDPAKQGRGASPTKVMKDLREPLIAHLGLPAVMKNFLSNMSEKQKSKITQDKIMESLDYKGNNTSVAKGKNVIDVFSFKESLKIKKAGVMYNRKNSPFVEIKRANLEGSPHKKDNFMQRIFQVKDKGPLTLEEVQVI